MTPQKEDYLKVIFELGGADNLITNKMIGTELSVSAASVTEMSAKLLKDDYILHIPYQGVRLSDKGLAYANKIIRKHRLWEVFLEKHLGFGWEEVHELAEMLEHVSPDILINRLEEFLGYPSVDPHGSVIPDRDGKQKKVSTKTLDELTVGNNFTIMEVVDDTEFLTYLTDKKIQLQNIFTLIEKESADGYYRFSDEVGRVYQISNQDSHKVRIHRDQ